MKRYCAAEGYQAVYDASPSGGAEAGGAERGGHSCLRFGWLPYSWAPHAGITSWARLRSDGMRPLGARPAQLGCFPARGNRLRLDRYDDEDLEAIAAGLRRAGLWMVE